MKVDDEPPHATRWKSRGSPATTPMLAVESFLRKSTGRSQKRQKLKHIRLGNTVRDASPTGLDATERPPPTITQPLTSTARRRKRKIGSRSSRANEIPVKGKAYRVRSRKPKAVLDDLVRTALTTHVDIDEGSLEDGRRPESQVDLGAQTNDLTQNIPATTRRRNLVHPSKTQPFPCEPSLGNTLADLKLGRHPQKPMTAWEGTLALSKSQLLPSHPEGKAVLFKVLPLSESVEGIPNSHSHH